MRIDRAIVVEGQHDAAAVQGAVLGYTIPTHGFGITQETWTLIDKAQKSTGIIVFTDPDHAGEQIRRRILERFPDAGQAWLTRAEANRNGKPGIEHASAESIREALSAYRAPDQRENPEPDLSMEDLFAAGLAGDPGALARRTEAGRRLGIGGGNSKAFLRKLNQFKITRKEFDEVVHALGNP